MRYRRPDDMLALCSVLALLLFVLQYFTISKFSVLDSAGYISLGHFLENVRDKIEFDPLDVVLGLGAVGVFAALVVLQVLRRRLTILLGWICASQWRAQWAVVLLGMVAVRYYFARGGMNWAGDASAHLTYAKIAAESLAAGEWPIWSNYLGCGTPYLQFYGFLFFYLVGLADFVCRDFYLAIKIVLAICHIASGWAIYGFVRQATRSRQAGLVAGLAYMLSFWHVQQVLVMGRYPLAAIYALLPLPFWAFERGGRVAALWGGIALGALAFAHPGYAFWATGFWCVYAAVRVGTDVRMRARVGEALTLLVTGVAFGAYLTLPMVLERGYTILRGGIEMTRVPDPTWQHLLYWSNHHLRLWRLPDGALHWYGGYVGVSLVVLACVGIVWAVRRREGVYIATVAGLVLSLVLVFGFRWSWLQALPFVSSFNAARYLLFVVFFLSAAAGLGARALRIYRGRRLGVVVLLVLFVDLGPTTLLDVYSTPDEAPSEILDEVAATVPEGESERLPSARMMTTLGGTHPYLGFSWAYYKTGIPLAQADPGNLLPASDQFANAFGVFLNRALARLAVAEDMAAIRASSIIPAGVKLLNVRHVVATQEGGGQRWLSWGWQSPVLVSSRIEGYATDDLPKALGEEEVDLLLWQPAGLSRMQIFEQAYPIAGFIAQMGVDIGRSTCEVLFIDGLAEDEDLRTDPQVEVSRHQVWNQRVEVDVAVSAPAFARLAYAHYPELEVRVDGRIVEPLCTTGGFVCLRLAEGAHNIVLAPRLSSIRRVLLVLDLGLLVLAAAVWWRARQ